MESASALALLSAMITPAVLISACGLMILSTSARLARVMDRVRDMGRTMELVAGAESELAELRRVEAEWQLDLQVRRGRLIQRALTSFYLAVAVFVADILSIGAVSALHRAPWLPVILGVAGTLFLFYGCLQLIGETRLALRTVDRETRFALRLRDRRTGRPGPPED